MNGIKGEAGWQFLSNAVVEQAAKDYRVALKKLKTDPKNMAYGRMKKDCERFFRSQWIMMLTEIDGVWLMETLRKESGYEE